MDQLVEADLHVPRDSLDFLFTLSRHLVEKGLQRFTDEIVLQRSVIGQRCIRDRRA